MSSETISLKLENREVLGKAVKHLRREGQVPAVIHDHGKDSIHVMAPYMEMFKVYQNAGKHHPVNLTVDGKKYLALIRDAHFEPRKNDLQHIVFNAIKQNEKVETEVPVVLEGEIPAERASLMVLTQNETVMVEGLPKDLVDELKVDATGLTEVGDKLSVADIQVPEGLTITSDPELTLAVVEIPRDQVAEANAAAAEQAAEDAAASGEAVAEPSTSSEQPATEDSEEKSS